MKTEFLQNLKVGDQPLSKEVIDAILNEHSRSIGTLKTENVSPGGDPSPTRGTPLPPSEEGAGQVIIRSATPKIK